jgi:hypothetical protein
MSIAVICHGCGQRFEVPDDFTRAKARCPECGVTSPVPQSARPKATAAPRARPAVAPPPAAEPDPFEDEAFRELAEPAPKETPKARPAKPAPPPKPEPAPAFPNLTIDDRQPDASDEDDGKPYRVPSLGERACPRCHRPLADDVVLCVGCGTDLRSGQKIVKTYEPVEYSWESGPPLRTRFLLFLAGQSMGALSGVLAVYFTEDPFAFAYPHVTFTILLAFLLGTYDRTDLKRNERGRVKLWKVWRICFIPRLPEQVRLGDYEGVATGRVANVGWLDFLITFVLFGFGVLPAVLWWYFVIHKDSFFVALTQDHGYPALNVLRSWDDVQVRRIARTLADVTGMHYETHENVGKLRE